MSNIYNYCVYTIYKYLKIGVFIIQKYGEIYIIKLSGKVEKKEEQLVEEEVEYILSVLEDPKIILDLSEAMYITSKFLAMILNLKKRIIGSGDIKIVLNNKFIRKLFKITMLDNIFQIYEGLCY